MRRGFHWVFHVPPLTRTDWIVALLLFIVMNFIAYLASYELFMIKNPRILENANRWYQGHFAPNTIGTLLAGSPAMAPWRIKDPEYQKFISKDYRENPFGVFDYTTIDRAQVVPCDSRNGLAESHWLIPWIVAGIWRCCGFASWGALMVLYSGFFAFCGVVAYFLFRQVSARWLALALCVVYLFSGQMLTYFPHLRDFSRLPGMLLVSLAAVLLFRKPVTLRRYTGYGVLFGALLGLCCGLRNDFLALMPVLFLIALFGHPGKIRRNLVKALVFCVIAGALIGGALYYGNSLVSGMRNPSRAGMHNYIIGLASSAQKYPFTQPQYYDFLARGADFEVRCMLDVVGYFRHGQTMPPGYAHTGEYETFSKEFYFDIVRNFPADMAMRAWGSTAHLLQMPFSVIKRAEGRSVGWVIASGLEKISLEKAFLPGILIAVLVFSILAAWRLRLALLGALFILVLCGIQIGQFQQRHYFGYGFIGLFLLALLIQQGYRLGRLLCRRHGRKFLFQRRNLKCMATRLAIFWGVFLLGWAGSVYGMRSYQVRHLETVFRSFASWPCRPLETRLEVNRGVCRLYFPELTEIQKKLTKEDNPFNQSNFVKYVAVRFRFKEAATGKARFYISQPNGSLNPTRMMLPVPAAGEYLFLAPMFLWPNFSKEPYLEFPDGIADATVEAVVWEELDRLPFYPGLLWIDLNFGNQKARYCEFAGKLI